jgi:RNA polymerase sigma-70 factor (ECF subfamily)
VPSVTAGGTRTRARWVLMSGPDDADLAAGFAAGDEAAVRAVYARYAGPIVTVAMGTLGKRELADEVVQTTMLKAWRAAASFDPTRDLAPWLYAIARRVAIDIYRRETRAGTPEELSDDRAAVVPLSFERTWEAWEVRSALDQLPPDEREVVRLAHFLGMTHAEIAEHLNVPVGTVKSRSNRAYKRLAALLSHVVRATE